MAKALELVGDLVSVFRESPEPATDAERGALVAQARTFASRLRQAAAELDVWAGDLARPLAAPPAPALSSSPEPAAADVCSCGPRVPEDDDPCCPLHGCRCPSAAAHLVSPCDWGREVPS